MSCFKISFIATLVFYAAVTAAKTAPAQGKIIYNMTIELRKQLAKHNPMLAQILPEKQLMQITLNYKGEVYSILQQSIQMPPSGKGGSSFNINVSAGMDSQREIINARTGLSRQEYVFKKRNFYTETLPEPGVTVTYTNETRNILGYTCYKAIVMHEGKREIAWYTREFPYSYQPEAMLRSKINGTVLAYYGTDYSIVATSISPAFSVDAITPKSLSRKITKEQVEDLQEESMEDMKKESVETTTGNKKTIRRTQTIKIK